jgi:aerobic carbon-monoxide dehydrogenase medium subunit
VIPAAFEYRRVGSVEEAVELVAADEDAKLLAGGHSLIPAMKLRIVRPTTLVDIGRLGDLRYVREDDDRIAIGALTRHAELVADPVLERACAVLARTAGEVGDRQVRNRGTIGGSVSHADPASDLPAVLLALDADFVARGTDGERTIPATEFFAGPFQSALAADEVLVEIRVPTVERGVYLKQSRRAQDWATVGVAAAHVGGRVQVGFASMGATPLRARGVEQALADGASPSDAAVHAVDGAEPPSDIGASSEYRADLARVLVRRALEQL